MEQIWWRHVRCGLEASAELFKQKGAQTGDVKRNRFIVIEMLISTT